MLPPLVHQDGIARDPRHFEPPGIPFLNRIAAGLATRLRLIPTPGIRAVDFSFWQDPNDINYDALCDPDSPFPIDAAILKISQGRNTDPAFPIHWPRLHDRGMPVLGYHYNDSRIPAATQADVCLSAAQGLIAAQGGLAIADDIEGNDFNVPNSVRREIVSDKLDAFAAAGVLPGMYSSKYYWSQLMAPLPSWFIEKMKKWWLWPASWGPGSAPTLPDGWSMAMVKFWQRGIWAVHPWLQPVPGMQPNVDVNAGYFPSRDAVFSWLRQGAPPPPPPPPPTTPCTFRAQVTFEATPHLNIRAQPSTSGQDVGNLPPGATLDVYEIHIDSFNNRWYLCIPDGQDNLAGWAAAVYNGKVYIVNL